MDLKGRDILCLTCQWVRFGCRSPNHTRERVEGFRIAALSLWGCSASRSILAGTIAASSGVNSRPGASSAAAGSVKESHLLPPLKLPRYEE